MPFIPHTQADIDAMLASIGESSIQALFDEIPNDLQAPQLNAIPEGINEQHLDRMMQQRSHLDEVRLSFLGAGAYEHHIPAAVWDITMRGEFLTAYTPYQAEASQGTLQLLYEYQSMMAGLTAMDVSNASLYDGASATAEAILMSLRIHKKNSSRRVLIAGSIHPHYRDTCEAIVRNQSIELVECPLNDGVVDQAALAELAAQPFAALIVAQPNFFGCLEAVDELTDWTHAENAHVIAVVNPTSLALLKPPGQWGAQGADIVVGEGQPLGIPLMSGGPYFGFLCTRKQFVRQMPGRLVGRTCDIDGNEGFALTLQAREQHIRRGKATSNICTNQGLLVTAATIYLSLLGPEGLRKVALACHQRTRELMTKLTAINGFDRAFAAPFFHEAVLRVSEPVDALLQRCQQQGVLAGLSLQPYFNDMPNTLLVCATETKASDDIDRLINVIKAG